MTNEQIQALKAAESIAEQLPAALDAWEKSNQGSVTLGWIHAANPVAVQFLLAEREADKAENEKLRGWVAELERKLSMANDRMLSWKKDALEAKQRIAELKTRTLTLPPKIERNDIDGWCMYQGHRISPLAGNAYNTAIADVAAACAAAGITLKVGGEDGAN